MLLTLSAKSLAAHIESDDSDLDLLSLPQFAITEFELHGLNLQTTFLAGWKLDQLDRLRDQADKVGCPWLTLVEEQAHPLAHKKEDRVEQAKDRINRVLRVGQRLGCAAVGIGIDAPASEEALETVSERLKRILAKAEQFELNLLLAPNPGMTETPERLTALIRKVGGFRIGSFPDFETAAGTGDAAGYLRAITPYASAVTASTTKFDKKGVHSGFDLSACLDAIKSVGFEGTLSLEYRGEGDPIEAVHAARQAVETHLEVKSS